MAAAGHERTGLAKVSAHERLDLTRLRGPGSIVTESSKRGVDE